jgi:uncharacterized protein
MENKEIIARTESLVKEKVKGYDSGHDWWHICRVRKLAEKINLYEKLENPFLVDMAALLHDYADSKFAVTGNGDENEQLITFLESVNLDEVAIGRIINVIKHISFSSRNKTGKIEDPLLYLIQDADRLDAIGAIGIARAFNYGGFRNNLIYSPDETENIRSTIKHFDDKLLLLKSLLNTGTAKRIAVKRHRYMISFLQRFHAEWNQEDI